MLPKHNLELGILVGLTNVQIRPWAMRQKTQNLITPTQIETRIRTVIIIIIIIIIIRSMFVYT